MKRLSNRIKNRIAELAAAGWTTRDIAKKYKCSESTAHTYTGRKRKPRKYVKSGKQVRPVQSDPVFSNIEHEIIKQTACLIADRIAVKMDF